MNPLVLVLKRTPRTALRTAAPPITSAENQRATGLRRVGKRIAIGMENDLWLVLHLMIAGRLHWKKKQDFITPDGRRTLAAFRACPMP